MIKIVYLLLAFNATQIFAQELARKQLNGKVSGDFITLENINIINKVTKEISTTNQLGFFKIQAKANDTLLFSSKQFLELKICVTQNDLKQNIFTVKLDQAINQLKEVVVQSNINAVSLSNPKRAKKLYGSRTKVVHRNKS